MSNQEKGSQPNTSEAGGVASQLSGSEQISTPELLLPSDSEVLVNQDVSQQEAGKASSPSGSHLIRDARRAKKGLIELSQKNWSKKETIRHFMGQAGQLFQKPQSNLHENKHDFAKMKTEFQTLMAGHR